MAKIQPVWAIDIGQAALKALKLVPNDDPDKLLAEAFDYIEYDKILSQPDADPEELVRDALATFLGRNDLKGSKIVLGVSGQAGLVKFIKLPPVEKKRIPDIVNFEVRQHIPFSLDEVIWDYQQIGGDDGEEEEFTMAEVGLFAMKRDQVHRAILPLKNAGLEVDVVQMGPIALFNFATFDQIAAKKSDEPESKSGSTVYIDIGSDNTDLIITDGDRIWQRNVPIGGNHFTRALTKELKLTFSKAEHLKKNATKAPDPRAVFTAMRGIFNDFSSEVSRSIGFYSSVNRNAKIDKIVGLGNGFKLPGLQKFLQQNLNQEVEKLEAFDRLVGDEVVSAPQFVENLPSFAVVYGLAIQGIGRGALKTNLLPGELSQARMIRRKKPWALVASAMLMLGFTTLFFSDWAAWNKVRSDEYKNSVNRATTVSGAGKNYQSAFDQAKSSFNAVKSQGEALVGESTDSTNWPFILQVISDTLPNPSVELDMKPEDPKNIPILDQLRVHIDEIVPVWREDVSTWFNEEVTSVEKETMHLIDRSNPPSGPGWIVQIIGHHYNPPALASRDISDKGKETLDRLKSMSLALGPWPFLQYQVLPRFYAPQVRQLGIHHAAITGYSSDPEWTKTKGSTGQTIALRAREVSKSDNASGGTGGSSFARGRSGDSGGMGGGGGDLSAMMKASMGSSMGSMMGGRGMGRGMMEGGMFQTGAAASKEKLSTLYRTKFRLEFIWQPPAKDAPTKSIEDIKKELDAALKAGGTGAENFDPEKLANATKEAVQQRVREFSGQSTPTPPPGTPPKAPTTPPQTPAPGQPAAPAAPPATAPQPKP